MEYQEDVHFLIDHVPPKELELTLRNLDPQTPKNIETLENELLSQWGYSTQRNYSNTCRRLIDLGVAKRAEDRKNTLLISDLGIKVRKILDFSPEFYPDIVHFLHYSGSTVVRKYFLSYQWCTKMTWENMKLSSTQEYVDFVQSMIEMEFPSLFSLKKGGNFNAGGVSAWKAWINELNPRVFNDSDEINDLKPRIINDYRIALLGMDFLYSNKNLRYGDPVLLDESILSELAGIFFLDINTCRSLLTLSSKLSGFVNIRDSFAGTTLVLKRKFTLFDF